MQTENRRSFVKKSLATTVSLTFAGLIRAHGGEGTTNTTTADPCEITIMITTAAETTYPPSYWETTVASTDGNTTTTWNPDETTASTVEQHYVSLQKQPPFPIDDGDIPTSRKTSIL